MAPSRPLRPARRINPNPFSLRIFCPGAARLTGRLPTDHEINLSLAYKIRLGSVTVTLLNRQTATAADDDGFNTILGTFRNSGQPVLGNLDFRKVYLSTSPRLLQTA